MTQRLEHLGGQSKGLTPNPNLFAKKETRARKGKGRSPLADLARGKTPNSPGNDARTTTAALGHGRGQRLKEEEEKLPRRAPGRGLYAPAAGSPDALNVAPDASGDHRTHAQRGLQFGIAPDDGHRTLALASGASGHKG